jgi:hypothetical protein
MARRTSAISGFSSGCSLYEGLCWFKGTLLDVANDPVFERRKVVGVLLPPLLLVPPVYLAQDCLDLIRGDLILLRETLEVCVSEAFERTLLETFTYRSVGNRTRLLRSLRALSFFCNSFFCVSTVLD